MFGAFFIMVCTKMTKYFTNNYIPRKKKKIQISLKREEKIIIKSVIYTFN